MQTDWAYSTAPGASTGLLPSGGNCNNKLKTANTIALISSAQIKKLPSSVTDY